MLAYLFVMWSALFAANWVFNGLLVAVIVGAALIVGTLGLAHARRRLVARRNRDAR